ncbi:ABC transporter substrate-binding protein [Brucellaceae bacterium D45D]
MGMPSAMAETPKDQLIIGMNMSNMLTIDPAAVAGRESTAIITNVYDTPVRLNPKNREQVDPGLAEKWEIAADRSSISLTFRSDATFASGNPVRVEDAIWSWKRTLTQEMVGSASWQAYGFTAENFDEHVTVDGQTISVKLPVETDPNLVLYLFGKPSATSVLDREEVLKHERDGDMGAGWLTTNAAGSGPYKLRSWTSSDMLILERNDNYWSEKPAMRRILMRHMPESQTKRLMLERGDLDVGLALSVPDTVALQNNTDITVQAVPSSGFYFLAVSMKDERFAKRDVRLALRHLIDYHGINDTVMTNYGILHQRPVTPGVLGTMDNPGYKLDVPKAKELLAKAGYPDGFKTKLLVLNEPPFIDIATSIAETLGQAGIKAELMTGTGNQVYGPMRERKFEMIIGRGGGGQEPHPHSNLQALVINPDNADDAGLSGLIGWRTSFYDAELNRMANEALLIKDRSEQEKAYQFIQKKYEELVPAIQPISAVVDTVVFRSDVEGYYNHYGWTTRFETVTKDR